MSRFSISLLLIWGLVLLAPSASGGGLEIIRHQTEKDVDGVSPQPYVEALVGVANACNQKETAEAGRLVAEMVFFKTSKEYKQGDAGQVWSRNFGIINYFHHLAESSFQMSADKDRLKKRFAELDQQKPVQSLAVERPSLESRATYNAYEEALALTGGNVYRAVELIGMLGHDDVTNVPRQSSLFARGAIGAEIDPKIMARFEKATKACIDLHPDKVFDTNGPCPGAGGTFNYHMNFGMFLGCELAKKGFDKEKVSYIAMNAALLAAGALSQASGGATKDPYVKNFLQCAKDRCTDSSGYEFRLCEDVPQMLGYIYKRTTMSRFLMNDAAWLFNHGYNRPFQGGDGKFPRPSQWKAEWKKEWEGVEMMTDARFDQAVAQLDYRLMHLEYSAEAARKGAEVGAKRCSEYKASLKPAGLSEVAGQIYDRGYLDPHTDTKTMTRLPALARTAPATVRARDELAAAVAPLRSKLDYSSSTGDKPELPARLAAFRSKLSDKDITDEQAFQNMETYVDLTKDDEATGLLDQILAEPVSKHEFGEDIGWRHQRLVGKLIEKRPDFTIGHLIKALSGPGAEKAKSLIAGLREYTLEAWLQKEPSAESTGQLLTILELNPKLLEEGFGKKVAAALAGGYERMSEKDRARLMALIEKHYDLNKNAEPILEKMAVAFGDRTNEEKKQILEVFGKSRDKVSPAREARMVGALKDPELAGAAVKALRWLPGLSAPTVEALKPFAESQDVEVVKSAATAIMHASGDVPAGQDWVMGRIRSEKSPEKKAALVEAMRSRPESGPVYEAGAEFLLKLLDSDEPDEVRKQAAHSITNGFNQSRYHKRYLEIMKQRPNDLALIDSLYVFYLDGISRATELVDHAKTLPPGPAKTKLDRVIIGDISWYFAKPYLKELTSASQAGSENFLTAVEFLEHDRRHYPEIDTHLDGVLAELKAAKHPKAEAMEAALKRAREPK